MKEKILKTLNGRYSLEKRDMGALSHIHKGLYYFHCETYAIKDIGNLFFIEMKALFGLMKMETMVLSPEYKDLSFCNLDTINAMGNDTYLFEMYRSSLKDSDLSAYDKIRKDYACLPDYQTVPRWYDEYKLSSCLGKKGKKISADGERMLEDCFRLYLDLLHKAENCDPQKKKAETAKYVDRLIKEGGAAIDSMNKIIGQDMTGELVRKFMYNI